MTIPRNNITEAELDRPFETRTLFRSNDLLVREVARGDRGLCYITFDSYTDNRSLDRPGFGEHYFQARGIDAIHVLSRDNYWYQHAELPEALACVRDATALYFEVIAYGSSMGGFAALRYGATCGAMKGIAISPQYSLDPDVVPFENRWIFDASRIEFRDDATATLPIQYILYDPHDKQDRQHFDLFAERSPSLGLKVPYSGHPAGSYLVETSMFDQLFDGVRNGTLDARNYERELRARRRRSGQYFFAMSRRLSPSKLRQRIAMAQAAADVSPGNAIYVSNLATLLDEAERHEEAAALHHRAEALTPDNFYVLLNRVAHLEKLRHLDAARALAETLVDRFSDIPSLRDTRRRLRRTTRQRYWHGRLLRSLRLDSMFDRWWERLTDGTLDAGPRFDEMMRKWTKDAPARGKAP